MNNKQTTKSNTKSPGYHISLHLLIRFQCDADAVRQVGKNSPQNKSHDMLLNFRDLLGTGALNIQGR